MAFKQRTSTTCAFFVLVSMLSLSRGCLYSSTECQCGMKPAGGTCLRRKSASGNNVVCESYRCSGGYVCDCLGTELCKQEDCSATKSHYVPVQQMIPGAFGQEIPCIEAPTAVCVRSDGTPINSTPPAPSATPTSSPSPTPSPGPIARAQVCSGTAWPCETGYTCSCKGICKKLVKMDIRMTTDDGSSAYVCDTMLGSNGGVWLPISTFTYTGACEDMYIELTNGGGHAGASFTVEINNSGNVIPSGSTSLPTAVTLAPPAGYKNVLSYDYSSWPAAVTRANTGNSHGISDRMQQLFDNYGAEVISDEIGYSDNGLFVYRVKIPCPA